MRHGDGVEEDEGVVVRRRERALAMMARNALGEWQSAPTSAPARMVREEDGVAGG